MEIDLPERVCVEVWAGLNWLRVGFNGGPF
jgi:hypothetical protein